MSPRDRRLLADAEKVAALTANSDLIAAKAVDGGRGRPPETWEVTFRCRGVVGANPDGSPVYGEHHRVRIELGREYPRMPPGLRWLTPILHPNIEGAGDRRVCIDQPNWQIGHTLDRVVLMLGEMVQYKNYHCELTPPYPLDHRAAEWARGAERAGYFSKSRPVDPRSLERPAPAAAPRVRIRPAEPGEPRIRVAGRERPS